MVVKVALLIQELCSYSPSGTRTQGFQEETNSSLSSTEHWTKVGSLQEMCSHTPRRSLRCLRSELFEVMKALTP